MFYTGGSEARGVCRSHWEWKGWVLLKRATHERQHIDKSTFWNFSFSSFLLPISYWMQLYFCIFPSAFLCKAVIHCLVLGSLIQERCIYWSKSRTGPQTWLRIWSVFAKGKGWKRKKYSAKKEWSQGEFYQCVQFIGVRDFFTTTVGRFNHCFMQEK